MYILDLSHWNTMPTIDALKAANVEGVIHKATQGTTYVDPDCANRIAAIGAGGLLVGSYHFGTGDDPIAQSAHFLEVVNGIQGKLLALDWEGNPNGPTMRYQQAEAFVQSVHDKIGRWPLLYTSAGFISSGYLPKGYNGLLGNCPLWLAAYTDVRPPCPMPWQRYVLWQSSDGIVGSPLHLTGLPEDYDINLFDGTLGNLADWWGT